MWGKHGGWGVTEQEWLTCDDPKQMLGSNKAFGWITGDYRPSDRKLRLFACACIALCEQSKLAAATETYNYGEDGETISEVLSVVWHWCHEQREYDPPAAIKAMLLREIVGNPFRPATLPLHRRCWKCGRVSRIKDRLANLCACGIWSDGEPFCPWLSPAVKAIAQSIYDDRDWGVMPVLADALEEAGCQDEVILRHLRGQERKTDRSLLTVAQGWVPRDGHPSGEQMQNCWMPLRGPHVRGCWALDLILGHEL